MMHDDTYIIPNPPVLPIHSASIPQPPSLVVVDADMPRHAVATCQKIAEILEHMINIRMVTGGIDAYTLIEHYLRLAKGVTEQGNVYVRSRQRRDTHDKDGDE
ncbi:hypothetical protein HKD37_01G001064 [Glycine soja]|nr:hypothetical protein GmHk_01G001068 [Glycine max]